MEMGKGDTWREKNHEMLILVKKFYIFSIADFEGEHLLLICIT